MKILLMDIAVNTLDERFYKQTVEKKLDIVRDCVNYTKNKLNADFNDTVGQKVRAIITAPEYFFAQSASPDNPRQYDEQTARDIEKELVKISGIKDNHGILIIPGTIAWMKNMFPKIDPNFENPIKTNSWTGQFDQSRQLTKCMLISPVVKIEKNVYYQQKKERGVFYKNQASFAWEKYIKKEFDSKYREAIDTINVRGKYIGEPFFYTSTDYKKEDKLFKMPVVIKKENTNIQLSRNTAYFFLDGERIYKYHKQSDCQEVIDIVSVTN